MSRVCWVVVAEEVEVGGVRVRVYRAEKKIQRHPGARPHAWTREEAEEVARRRNQEVIVHATAALRVHRPECLRHEVYVGNRPVASFSYQAFDRLQERLAASIGIVLDEMLGFGGDTPWDPVDDPLATLVAHDEDALLAHGQDAQQINPQACGPLADRLEEVTRDWAGDHAEIARLLTEACRIAAAENCPLEFY